MPVYLGMTALATVFAFFACAVAARLPQELAGRPLAALRGQDTRKTALLFLVLVVASALPYVLVAGVRWNVGTDYAFTYEPMQYAFLHLGGLDAEHQVEIGYMLLCKLLAVFHLGITWLMLCSAAITVLFFWLAFYKMSEIPWLSVFLFAGTRHFFISLNGVRQYMAMAMVLFAFWFIREKCFWKYALCVGAAAVLWHVSVLIMLPLYFLRYVKLHPAVAIGALALSVVLKEPLMTLLRFLVEQTPYAWYAQSIFDGSQAIYLTKFWAMLPVFLAGCAYYFAGDNKNDAMYRVMFACQCGVLFFALNSNIIPLADRVSWMLEITQLLFVPMLLHREKRVWLRVLVGALMLGGILWLTYYEIFVQGNHEAGFYRTVFAPELVFQ